MYIFSKIYSWKIANIVYIIRMYVSKVLKIVQQSKIIKKFYYDYTTTSTVQFLNIFRKFSLLHNW